MSDRPDAWSKRPHKKGCHGDLYRPQPVQIVHVDRTGRRGNGGIIAYSYVCNMSWDGCPAEVLVTEGAQRAIAVAHEVRP